ncbi:uncharacterized protein TEOVI_000750100 [Trypanosoma equiperdum]|uniref:Uncharacterized protein n=2 Tax=Trypanozoon TaxID=39700 RepID=Q38FR9_TRYB2|nr:hypothetical protein, unlikely [Trypanosoma brucei brucei TREU927]EAN76351.1 hypothetical protein, unlikely [Trypanosoma brucei brucei TREU927]SCU67527.1 hypothetical protein, conserved [Trypanosoma equiperdum]
MLKKINTFILFSSCPQVYRKIRKESINQSTYKEDQHQHACNNMIIHEKTSPKSRAAAATIHTHKHTDAQKRTPIPPFYICHKTSSNKKATEKTQTHTNTQKFKNVKKQIHIKNSNNIYAKQHNQHQRTEAI